MRTHRKARPRWAAVGLAAAGLATTVPATFAADGPAAPAAETAQADNVNQQAADAVADALRAAGLRGTGIQIEVQNGVCRLVGQVPSPGMKALATKAAAAVAGVDRVDNGMTAPAPAVPSAPVADPAVTPAGAVAPTPAPTAGPSNQQVAERISVAVQQAGLAGYDMEIRFKDGRCTLSGRVADEAQVRRAVSAARGVAGVGEVRNELTVGAAPIQTAAAPAPNRAEIARRRAVMQQRYAMAGRIPPGMSPQPQGMPGRPAMPPRGVRPAAGQIAAPGCPPGAAPPAAAALGAGAVYNQAALPEYAWPTYAQHPNYAAVSYPKDYSASAWPYIGPFYPYPQVPLGWREVELEWDDGQWYLDFNDRTDNWYWFLHPENW